VAGGGKIPVQARGRRLIVRVILFDGAREWVGFGPGPPVPEEALRQPRPASAARERGDCLRRSCEPPRAIAGERRMPGALSPGCGQKAGFGVPMAFAST
jgi:hypothetical protein